MSFPLKAAARAVFNRLVARERFNDSRLYEAYLFVFRRPSFLIRRAEEEFYRRLIGRHALIFDIGASGGSKARIFSQLADRVVCVEPTPGAIASLRKRFLHKPGVTIVAKGVGETETLQKLHIFADTGAYNTISQKMVDALQAPAASSKLPQQVAKQVIEVPITTLDQLIGEFGVPDYIKIDVEGYELAVLRGLSRSVPLLSFECNLPEFADETEKCIARLAQLSPKATFNYAIEEPPTVFESPAWMSAADLVGVVRSGRLRYMEIYCKAAR